jgi:glycosyltransferase involved in cell wall biosynthesis
LSTHKQKIIIFNDYFYPGYRGGGPIQSLTNLAVALERSYEMYVVTSIYDLQSNEPYTQYEPNTFNKVLLPGSHQEIQVYYASTAGLTIESLQTIFDDIKPAVIYLNGMFSYRFFLSPIRVSKKLVNPPRIVICPRGMLQKGALAVKPLKKKFYLTFLTLSGLLRDAYWHATGTEEAQDIQRHFPKNKGITVAANIPKVPFSDITIPAKTPKSLRLVYLSLIAEKKNLLFLLQLISAADKNVTLDIYGPITDEKYWQQCKKIFEKMPEKVQYKGDVLPVAVQQTLAQYHALILPTKGENFGHAIYESLSVGRPVLISDYTPWLDLEKKKAGINLNIEDFEDCKIKLNRFLEMGQEEYETFCNGAIHLAETYYNNMDVEKKYVHLFS